MARRLGIDPDAPETNVVVLDGTAYFKFDTVLAVLGQLWGERVVRPVRAVPRRARNWGYDRIARNRYALFGRTETCMAPTHEAARRIIEAPRAAR